MTRQEVFAELASRDITRVELEIYAGSFETLIDKITTFPGGNLLEVERLYWENSDWNEPLTFEGSLALPFYEQFNKQNDFNWPDHIHFTLIWNVASQTITLKTEEKEEEI